MPKSSRPSDEIRKLLKPNAERLTFEISGPDIFIDGASQELVVRISALGETRETRTKLDSVQQMKAEARGIPVRWPKTRPKAPG